MTTATTYDHEQTLKHRFERLELYGYVLHRSVYPGSYGLNGAQPTPEGEAELARREARIRAVKLRILRRAAALRGEDLSLKYTVTWGPNRYETYLVEQAVLKGKDTRSHDLQVLAPAERILVESWPPLPSCSPDSELGQGFVDVPEHLVEIVRRRIEILEPDSGISVLDRVEDEIDPQPPVDWKTRGGYRLARLADKGQIPPAAMILAESCVPKRKISDDKALGQIAALVYGRTHSASDDLPRLLSEITDLVRKTGR